MILTQVKARDGISIPCGIWDGDKENILYLHGIESHMGWFEDMARRLQTKGFSVYAFDRRGSGLSKEIRGDTKSYKVLMNDIEDVVDSIRTERPGRRLYLMGVCGGGKFAVSFAGYNPKAIDGLILISPAIKTKVTLPLKDKLDVFLSSFLNPAKKIPTPLSDNMFTSNKRYTDFIKNDMLKVRELTARFYRELVMMDLFLAHRIFSLDMPILSILAGDDDIVDNERLKAWHDRLKARDKTLKVFEGCRHFLPFQENVDDVVDFVTRWIEKRRNAPHPRRGEGRIKEVHIMHVSLPLRVKFRHAITSRSESDSVFLKVTLDNGAVGYGESLPREYVTGEKAVSAVGELAGIVRRRVIGHALKTYNEIFSFVDSLGINGNAARCALELALIDAYGKFFNSPVSSIIGPPARERVIYSGVVQAGSALDAMMLTMAFRALGLAYIKVKVGIGDDMKRLKVVRAICGHAANIRVDANCAWTADEAIKRIDAMREYGITAVEQPVAAADFDGLKKVSDAVPETVIADESLCTVSDAKTLARIKACRMFNIRLSKCGGLSNAIRIADIAHKNGIGIQVGCQVGESGILSAGGWHFARLFNDAIFCEGSYGKYLLKEDVTKEDITIRRGGAIDGLSGPGLGVNIREDILNRYAVSKDVIR